MRTYTKEMAYCLLLIIINFTSSCGDDRVNDSKGQIFLAAGQLVKANTDFDEHDIYLALTEHEWTLDNAFYYDKSTVSEKESIDRAPVAIHQNGKFEMGGAYKYWDWKIKETELEITYPTDITSSSTNAPRYYNVVAIDYNIAGGLLVLDEKINYDVAGFNTKTLYCRMVFKLFYK